MISIPVVLQTFLLQIGNKNGRAWLVGIDCLCWGSLEVLERL
jgi:hypothetical protein